jgi:hypothetical protein
MAGSSEISQGVVVSVVAGFGVPLYMDMKKTLEPSQQAKEDKREEEREAERQPPPPPPPPPSPKASDPRLKGGGPV